MQPTREIPTPGTPATTCECTPQTPCEVCLDIALGCHSPGDDCLGYFTPYDVEAAVRAGVAAREAAAREEGRAEQRVETRRERETRDLAEWEMHARGREVARLRAEVAAAEQRGAEKALRDVIERLRGFGVDPAVVEHFTVLLAVQQSHAATARAAAVTDA